MQIISEFENLQRNAYAGPWVILVSMEIMILAL